ncbi:MAG: LOG family protein, partial [Candidatus Hydrogenedentota bacterium]
KQLDFHRQPIVILNTNGYYNALFAFFDHMVDQAFVKKEHLKLVKVVSTPEGAIAGISEYNDPEAVSKY